MGRAARVRVSAGALALMGAWAAYTHSPPAPNQAAPRGPLSDRAGLQKWRADLETMRSRVGRLVRQGKRKDEVSQTLVKDFGWAAGGLAIQQVDAFIAEMKQ